MFHEVIDRLLRHWKANFFTEPVLILTFIFCFIVALRRHYKEKERILFVFYFAMGVTLFVFANTVDIFGLFGKRSTTFLEVCNTIFELVEFIAFYFFFKKCLGKRYHRISQIFLLVLLSIMVIFFCGIFLVPSYSLAQIKRDSLTINTVEFLFLGIWCLGYLYEVFRLPSAANLVRRPSFFITCSTLFYSTLLIPFFLVAPEILERERWFANMLFSCHYVLLTILVLTIFKAFLWRKPITI